MLENFDGTESLCVSYERKSKPPVYTKDQSVLLNKNDEITANFKETMKVEVTLYKDGKTGMFKVSSIPLCTTLQIFNDIQKMTVSFHRTGKNWQSICFTTQTRCGWSGREQQGLVQDDRLRDDPSARDRVGRERRHLNGAARSAVAFAVVCQ